MSPEPLAADRTYLSLKRDIVAGKFAPGASFNLQRLAEEFGTSITPVRDAIHRMVGERLLGVLPGGGFHLPVPSAEELRGLYVWHEQLIRLALPPRFAGAGFAAIAEGASPRSGEDLADATSRFFALLAATSGSSEITNAHANASERLSPARLREATLIKGIAAELDILVDLAGSGGATAMRKALSEYHRRRLRRVDRIALALRS